MKYKLRCSLQKIGDNTVAIFDTQSQRIQKYYTYKGTQLVPKSKKAGKTVEYNPLSNLCPTPENVLHKSITKIIEEITQNES